MEIKKYPKGCWSKLVYSLITICLIAFGFMIHMNVIMKRNIERLWLERIKEDMVPMESLVTCFVNYQDSVYLVLVSDIYLFDSLSKCGINIDNLGLTYYQLVNLWYHDTLKVDSCAFSALKRYKVLPQHRIDSIYEKGGIAALVNCFFDNRCYVDTTLTDVEMRYLFDVMQRDSCRFAFDDESGYVFFRENIQIVN